MPPTLDTSDIACRMRLRPDERRRPAEAHVAYLGERAAGSPATVYVAALDGTGGRAVLGDEPATGSAVAVCWNSLGRTLACVMRRPDGQSASLWLVEAQGGLARRVSDGLLPYASLADIAWSKDGGRLEFAAAEAASGRTARFSVDARGEKVRRLESAPPDGARLMAFSSARARPGGEQMLRPSPCGSRLAFVKNGEEAGDTGLWVEDRARGERRRLPAGLRVGDRVEAIDWTPDGRRIVFAVAGRDGERALRSADAEGQSEAWTIASGSVPDDARAPAFRVARDGSTAVFRTEGSPSGRQALCAADLCGGPAREVSDPAARLARILDFVL